MYNIYIYIYIYIYTRQFLFCCKEDKYSGDYHSKVYDDVIREKDVARLHVSLFAAGFAEDVDRSCIADQGKAGNNDHQLVFGDFAKA